MSIKSKLKWGWKGAAVIGSFLFWLLSFKSVRARVWTFMTKKR